MIPELEWRGYEHAAARGLLNSYNRLAITIGDDPTARITLTGRGNRIPQELDLTVNLRSQK